MHGRESVPSEPAGHSQFLGYFVGHLRRAGDPDHDADLGESEQSILSEPQEIRVRELGESGRVARGKHGPPCVVLG